MSADTKHDEPLGFLDAVFVGLRVAEALGVYGAGVFDFRFGAVSDEDGLAAPFDDHLEKKFSVVRIEISGEERLGNSHSCLRGLRRGRLRLWLVRGRPLMLTC